jgi:tRNA modification GTPase
MRFNLTDTIAAIATPAGTSALAVTRVSGSNAVQIVSNVFSHPQKLTQAHGYQAVHGYIADKDEVIDEVVCLVFYNPHSYTGEDMVEITGHGNPDLANRILQLLLKSCRLAEPGEFTFRAFMNNKLDLAQAEAVSDLIHAQTAKAEAAALNQLKGNLSKEISALMVDLTDCRIQFELSIDFADQDLPELDLGAVKTRLEVIRSQLQIIQEGGRQGRILRDGFTVCLSGAPNVGKSSVFNKFLSENRAIVTPVPGTTRDYLQEWLSIEGYPIRLLDTAGLRDTKDEVEQLGIDRTKELISSADLVVLLTDPDTLDNKCCRPDAQYAAKTVCVMNKTDLLGFEELPAEADWNKYLKGSRFAAKIDASIRLIPCSTFLPDGISRLREHITSRISLPDLQPSTVLVTNTRHLAAIERCLSSLSKALEAISVSAGYEFIAFDLIETISSLSEITGAVTTDDMLERIFSGFCIGK